MALSGVALGDVDIGHEVEMDHRGGGGKSI